jgi:hypothetical protein
MALREKLVGMATPERPQGLIYPVIFCDSENFPDWAKQRRMRSMRSWNVPDPQFQTTIGYVDFHHAVEHIAEDLVRLIDQAPAWRPDWPVRTPRPEPAKPSRLPRF